MSNTPHLDRTRKEFLLGNRLSPFALQPMDHEGTSMFGKFVVSMMILMVVGFIVLVLVNPHDPCATEESRTDLRCVGAHSNHLMIYPNAH